ncbi:MAG: DUF6702 family protein [Bacteroidota bacterium]
MMKNLMLGLIGLLGLLGPILSFAHNPLSARYHFEVGAEVSLLTISLSQDGVHQALIKGYGRERLEVSTEKEYKELLVAYVKKNFQLQIDQTKMVLKQGGLKLGSHQTDLKFVLPPIARKITQMEVTITAFQENEHHQTIFTYPIDGKTKYVVLNASNDYQATVRLRGGGSTVYRWPRFIFMVLMILLFLQ